MKKLSLLAAASVLVMSTSAYAGQLELKVKNINGNGNTAADDAIDTASGVTTIDRPGFIIRTTTTPNPLHPDLAPITTTGKIKSSGAAVGSERIISEEHPFDAHFEVNATRIDEDGELTEFLPDEFLLMLAVNNATFKVDLNGEDLIRNGMMGEGNLDADVLALTGAEGSSTAEVSVVNQGNGRQTDFGLLLPLRITGGDNDILTPCEPVEVQVQAFSTVGFGGPSALGAPDSITIMTCEPSFGFSASGDFAKIDFQTDFKSFLTQDTHESRTDITVGSFALDIWNNLFDPKADPDSDDRIVDSSDIDSHEIVFSFEDLTGIQAVDLVDAAVGGNPIASGVLDRNANTVTFEVGPDDYDFVADTIEDDIDHDDNVEITQVEESTRAWLSLTAFPAGTPKFDKVETVDAKGDVTITKVPTGAGAIDHQVISIASNTLNLVEPCKERDGVTINGDTGGDAKTPKFICEIPLPTGPFAELTLTGQNFGPFDWVGQGNALTRNFFRVSHLPLVDGHGEPITSLKGVLTLKNTSGGGGAPGELFDDTYKFELPFDPALVNVGANGVYLITPAAITNILNDGGAPSAAFGTTDMSFTFFVNSAPGGAPANPFTDSENFKIDVDRLMINSDGSMTAYGDNANDSNSEHAVSGDDGRFGPKVPLKFIKEVQ